MTENYQIKLQAVTGEKPVKSGRILIVTAGGVPHPVVGASSVLFYKYIEAIKQHGYEALHLLVLEKHADNEREIQEYTNTISKAGFFEVFPVKLERFNLFRGITRQLYPAEIPEVVVQKLDAFDADVIFCLDIMAAGLVSKVRSKARCVWLGDLTFQTMFYHGLYGIRERSISIANFLLHLILARRWKRFYKRILPQFDRIIVSSHSSVAALKKLGQGSIYLPYPWPDNHVQVHGKQPELPSFLFLGTLTGLGSRSAFHYLLYDIYPRLLKVWCENGFRILICGSRSLPDWVITEINGMSEIKFLGFVDELGEIMAKVHAVIAPIDVPVGNRSRIITAMAMKTPVIAHANTALGNPSLVNGKTCLLAHTPDEFIDAMKISAEKTDYIKELVENARKEYECSFMPENACPGLIRELDELMSSINSVEVQAG